MKVISTNIARPETVFWKGRQVTSGIFKMPVNEALFLDKEQVSNDHVIDRRVHGGVDKACYLYSADYYPYWQNKYAHLNWTFGMFGENLTVEGLDESAIHMGDIFKAGEAVIQASQPRQPCFKLGIKFNNQGILKEFIQYNHPGIYVRVLQTGRVSKGDDLIRLEKQENAISISDLFRLIFQKEKDPFLLEKALKDKNLPDNLRTAFGIIV
jgi:MOSC domain-containing protein YiiM